MSHRPREVDHLQHIDEIYPLYYESHTFYWRYMQPRIAQMKRNRRAKFVELATNRVNRALRDIKLIGNLSNRSAYEYSEEDVRKIVRALTKEVESMRGRFASPGSVGDSDFSL